MGELGGEEVGVAVDYDLGTATICLKGEFDISNAELIRTSLDSPQAREINTVIVDAVDLRFMDSSGLSAIVAIANKYGGSVAVRNANSLVRRLVETSGLSPVLRLETSVE